ncbi:natural killer cells antigen CD94-like isoform X2 [Sander lucioperca]|uniref:natural killer cells antigen CD94-like isoform X2 n=1 Tax=Sander lucioperca TaxID=283035 RepID=UPI00125E3FB1|nr:natural killer cells antigen CD94-like isoform X2 [Sander lucioperca]
MSSNIYEDPDLTMDVKYSKGAREDRGERVERVIDIYESVDTSTNRRVPTQRGGAHTQNHPPAVQRNPFRAAALVLGLLCLLLVAGVIVLANLCEDLELQTSNKELQTSYNKLSNSFCQETKNQTHGWRRFQCSCYYQSIEMKTWTESRTDCQNRGADLVIINSKDENDFVSELNKTETSWIGLQSVSTNDWSKEEWKWKWVDESTLSYRSWLTGVNVNPVKESTAYMDRDGNWNYSNNGLKRWICEKHIYKV